MATPFETFINTELPQRTVTIRGTDATGNPNDSSVPKVVGAPIGTLYLRDDTVPKAQWLRTGTASNTWRPIENVAFRVGTSGICTHPTIAGGVGAAGLVATEDNWQVVFVEPGEYDEGVIDLPPWLYVTTGVPLGEAGEQVASLHGGFRVAGSGSRIVQGLKIYAENVDNALRLIDVPKQPPPFVEALTLVECYLEHAALSPSITGRVIYTEMRIGLARCVATSVGITAGVRPPVVIAPASGGPTAQITGVDAGFRHLVETSPNDVLVLVDASADFANAQFQTSGRSSVQGNVKAVGGVTHNADIVLEGGTYYSNIQSAFELSGSRARLILWHGLSAISSISGYAIKGTGQFLWAGFVSGFTSFSLDPALTVSQGYAWMACNPADGGDWFEPPVDVSTAIDLLAARITPFTVGSGAGCTHPELADAIADAALVATEDDWATILVRSGDYGDGSVVDLPPWLNIVATPPAEWTGTSDRVSFWGGFRVVDGGERRIEGIQIHAKTADDYRLIDVPVQTVYRPNSLTLVKCYLLHLSTSKSLDGFVLDTQMKITLENCYTDCLGIGSGTHPAIRAHDNGTFAATLRMYNSFVNLGVELSDTILVLLDETLSTQAILQGTQIQGVAKAIDGEFILGESCRVWSNVRHAFDLVGNGRLVIEHPVYLANVGAYTVIGDGEVARASVVTGWSSFTLDPALTVTEIGAWFGYEPAESTDWLVEPKEMGVGLDELAYRAIRGGAWASRPTTNLFDGRTYFDTALKKPFWYNAGDTTWYDAAGVAHP